MDHGGFGTVKAERGAVTVSVEIPAEVQFNPDRVAHVSSLVAGQLTEVSATLGTRVQAGQVLAKLRSVELGQARAELARTAALRSTARKNRDRQKRLRAEGISSERKRLEAELALQQAEAERSAAVSRLRVFGVRGGDGPELELVSPTDGVVVERHATRGENVSVQDTLFVVADMSRVWLIGRVYEQQVAQVAVGMGATLKLNAYPRREWKGTVDFVGARLDEQTRTLPIRVELENPDGALRPGLFGTLELSSGDAAPRPLVPLDAVQTVDDRTVVFVPGAPGTFSARRVETGREDRERVEIVNGLSVGEPVVAQGAFILKSQLMRHALGEGCAH